MDLKPCPSPHPSARPWIHPISTSAALSPPHCPTLAVVQLSKRATQISALSFPASHTPSHLSPALFLQECPLFLHPLVYIHVPGYCAAWTLERGSMHFQFRSQGYFVLNVKCTHWLHQAGDSRPATPTASAGPSACTL